MLYMDPITGLDAQPTVYVDITPFFEKKCELLRLHKSQMEYMAKWANWDLVDYAEIVNRFRGLQCGVKYAEAFSPVLSYSRLRPESNLP
jgi:LmbE family N-acetylglucosaminyl deacetylase